MISASIVIPNYNSGEDLGRCLEALKQQSRSDFEIIVSDDASTDNSVEIAKRYADQIILADKNRGPAAARNKGIKASKSYVILFLDSDCLPSADWFEKMISQFLDYNIDVVMGKVTIQKSNFIGDSISALGYPAGGSLGFEKMWRVSKEGFTSTFSTCNCGIRKKIFDRYGLFDEDFPYAGGEDTLLAARIFNDGINIKYCANVGIYHKARSDLRSFISWQIKRGYSIYLFKKKIGPIRSKILNRIWSIVNVMRYNLFSSKILLIIPLLIISLFCQQIGYRRALIIDKSK